MNVILKEIIASSVSKNEEYKPLFFRINKDEDKIGLFKLLNEKPHLRIFDEIQSQLEELVKCLNPKIVFTKETLKEASREYLGNKLPEEYGVWVYYSWSNSVVHILDKEEFIKVRTNRNQFKITPEEQQTLSQKKVGVIGLSVGQSVCLAMAMERSFGELRIADFDQLDLSNLNRIRAGVQNLQIKKTIICAREIAEIDPFLKVICFDNGITEENIESFFIEGGRLDALIEECDGISIKIKSRILAKDFGIPVIMDTSDRGMLDIERFDLNKDLPLFHGLLEKFNIQEDVKNPQRIKDLIFAILDKEKISKRFRDSIEEIGKSLTTWPQLASSVVAGGANAADVYRKIMLGFPVPSGRYYIDLDELVR